MDGEVAHDDLCGCGELAEDCAHGYGLAPEPFEPDPLEEIARLENERAAYYEAVAVNERLRSRVA